MGTADRQNKKGEATSDGPTASAPTSKISEASLQNWNESEAQVVYHKAQGSAPQLALPQSESPRTGIEMPSQSTFDDELRPIARKKSIRALTRNPETNHKLPLCQVEVIHTAWRASGWNAEKIAQLCGRSRPTVLAALHAKPSCKLYDFCAVITVLGLQMGDVFPVRSSRRRVPQWLAGPHVEENTQEIVEDHERRPARRINR
jgi:hypothetical protein